MVVPKLDMHNIGTWSMFYTSIVRNVSYRPGGRLMSGGDWWGWCHDDTLRESPELGADREMLTGAGPGPSWYTARAVSLGQPRCQDTTLCSPLCHINTRCRPDIRGLTHGGHPPGQLALRRHQGQGAGRGGGGQVQAAGRGREAEVGQRGQARQEAESEVQVPSLQDVKIPEEDGQRPGANEDGGDQCGVRQAQGHHPPPLGPQPGHRQGEVWEADQDQPPPHRHQLHPDSPAHPGLRGGGSGHPARAAHPQPLQGPGDQPGGRGERGRGAGQGDLRLPRQRDPGERERCGDRDRVPGLDRAQLHTGHQVRHLTLYSDAQL